MDISRLLMLTVRTLIGFYVALHTIILCIFLITYNPNPIVDYSSGHNESSEMVLSFLMFVSVVPIVAMGAYYYRSTASRRIGISLLILAATTYFGIFVFPGLVS
jgi:hypothetical protein